jgi:hypothetical protein
MGFKNRQSAPTVMRQLEAAGHIVIAATGRHQRVVTITASGRRTAPTAVEYGGLDPAGQAGGEARP